MGHSRAQGRKLDKNWAIKPWRYTGGWPGSKNEGANAAFDVPGSAAY